MNQLHLKLMESPRSSSNINPKQISSNSKNLPYNNSLLGGNHNRQISGIEKNDGSNAESIN